MQIIWSKSSGHMSHLIDLIELIPLIIYLVSFDLSHLSWFFDHMCCLIWLNETDSFNRLFHVIWSDSFDLGCILDKVKLEYFGNSQSVCLFVCSKSFDPVRTRCLIEQIRLIWFVWSLTQCHLIWFCCFLLWLRVYSNIPTVIGCLFRYLFVSWPYCMCYMCFHFE